MEFESQLRYYKALAEEGLTQFFEQQEEEFKNYGDDALDSLKRIQNLVMSGGKRIRPVLMIAGYGATGGSNTPAIAAASTCKELEHNYYLIHDDVMDQDAIRRGQKTIHIQYAEKFNDIHLGNSLAITDGDLLESLAQKALTDSEFPAENKDKALQEYQRSKQLTGIGQKLDLLSRVRKVDEDYILRIHKYKTSQYTIASPVKMGTHLAGEKRDFILEALQEYGINCGIAFQLKDDELGLTPKKLGKEKNDLAEGKKTLITVRTREQLSDVDKGIFVNCLGAENKEAHDKALELIKSTDAIAYNKEKYKYYSNAAVDTIKRNAVLTKEGKEFLYYFARYVIERTK